LFQYDDVEHSPGSGKLIRNINTSWKRPNIFVQLKGICDGRLLRSSSPVDTMVCLSQNEEIGTIAYDVQLLQ
jgi:hypothetical protein